MRRLRSLAIWGCASAFLIWAGICLAFFLGRYSLIYPFDPTLSTPQPVGIPDAKSVQLAAADGTPLTIWLAPPRGARPVILFFMGNAGNLAANIPRLAELAYSGFGIAALNYRGAGGAPGYPSQTALINDALTLYDGLDGLMGGAIPSGRRVIYGTSLGAAVAAQLAARRQAGAVVLGAPFARLCEAGQHHYPLIPVCLLLPDNRWDSLEAVRKIEAPVLILHGTADEVIPISQAEKLFAAANQPKTFLRYPGGRHSDLRLHGSGQDTIEWLEGLR
ncbi:MAG: alpha/beta hydrolase [Pseudomonadota bacterium]